MSATDSPAPHDERGALGATCVPASTASPVKTPPTSSTPSPSSAAATGPPCGHNHTKAMILAYFNAPAAGDTTTDVAV